MEAELSTLWYTNIGAFAATEGLAVSYPNVPFNPPSANHYLKVYTFPTTPEVFDLCGSAIHIWILQASVYTRDGVGEVATKRYVDKLADAFPALHEFVGVVQAYQVVSPPSPAPPVQLDSWFSIPVSFNIKTIHYR